MKSKIIKKMLVVVGILIAGSVVILPSNSHAAVSCNAANTECSTGVTLSIQPSISISITGSTVGALQVDPGGTTEGSFTVQVSSNKHYTLSLKATSSANLVGTNDNIAPATNFSGTTTGWAYKLDGGAWTAPTTGGSVLYNSSTGGSFAGLGQENITFKVGVGASRTVAAGSYTGSITVTAAAN